jgi:hypothetical protein
MTKNMQTDDDNAATGAASTPAPTTTVAPADITFSLKLRKTMTAIDSGNCRFVISDSPTNANLDAYVSEWQRRNVDLVVRACEDSYDTALLTAEGRCEIPLSLSRFCQSFY